MLPCFDCFAKSLHNFRMSCMVWGGMGWGIPCHSSIFQSHWTLHHPKQSSALVQNRRSQNANHCNPRITDLHNHKIQNPRIHNPRIPESHNYKITGSTNRRITKPQVHNITELLNLKILKSQNHWISEFKIPGGAESHDYRITKSRFSESPNHRIN